MFVIACIFTCYYFHRWTIAVHINGLETQLSAGKGGYIIRNKIQRIWRSKPLSHDTLTRDGHWSSLYRIETVFISKTYKCRIQMIIEMLFQKRMGFTPLCLPTFCRQRRIYIVMIIRAHQVLYSAVHNNIFLVTRAEKQNVENVPEPIKASQGSFTLEFSPKQGVRAPQFSSVQYIA